MIKNFKSKKLIMQIIAFLLMFTLTIGNLPFKAFARTYQEGDKAVVKLHTTASCSYTIEATYTGGAWTLTGTDNKILCNGQKADQPSFWLSLIKSYVGETKSASAKDMVIKALEFYVEQSGNTVTCDRERLEENRIIISCEDGKAKWGKYGGQNYKDVINRGNPGENSSKHGAVDMSKVNPLYCGAASEMDDAMKSLQVNGTPITAMTDEAWLALILDCETPPSWINLTYSSGGQSISADASGYYAKLEVPDADKTSGNILIKVYDKDDKNVIDFKFGEITGQGKYREITYSNADRTKVAVIPDDDGYALSIDVSKAVSSLSLYKTASGSTIDTYHDKIKKDNILNFKKQVECFTAVKDASGNMVLIYGGTEAKSNKAKLTLLCSVDLGLLEELFGKKTFQALTGEWVFELVSENDEIVIAYKEDDPDPEANGWYYYLSEFKSMRVEDALYYDLMVPTKETKSGTKTTTQPYKRGLPFSVLKGNPSVKGNDASLTTSRDALYTEILNGGTVYCSTRTMRYDGKVGTNSKPLLLGDTYFDGNEPEGKDYPPDFPINDFIMVSEDMDKILHGEGEIIDDITAKLGENKSEIKHNFVEDVLYYGRIIILFLILIAICYTAILSIQSAADVQKRVLIKERIKDILIGIIIFMCIIPIFNLVAEFLNDSYQSLGDFTGQFSGPTYYATVTRFKVGYIVKFIANVLDIFTKAINTLIDDVLAYSMTPGTSVNLMQLIYTATNIDGTVSNLLPFTDQEWALYVMGYRMLSVLFLGLVAISLVKVAAEFMINAGNASKIEASKETAKRIFIAIILVVLAPYGFRLLLLFFNYLTAMLPIDGATAVFDIDFKAAGFVGSIANLLFATTRFRIFVVFYIRKVMLALMLFSTPFVCGVWAVSNKFRSFSLWVGTILSNAALQFCYALVFMVVILISYEGQNPFVKLIVVLLIPKFASFFSKSLQGLGQVWGGINQEAVANEIVNSYKGWGKKGVAKVKKTGRNLQKISKKFDPKEISKWGRRVNNVGALMALDPLSVRTKGETLRNRAELADVDRDKAKKILDNAGRNKNMILLGRGQGDAVYEYNLALENQDYERASQIRGEGTDFDIIDDYYQANRDYELADNYYQAINARANSTRFVDQGILGTPQALLNRSQEKSMYREIDRLYDDLSVSASKAREERKGQKGSDEKLSAILDKTQKTISKRTAGKSQRSLKDINKDVDSTFKELITYMENAEHKETIQLEISDAIFASLFDKKTEVNGFSPEMAVKYQETKDQYFGAVDSKIDEVIMKTVSQTATIAEMQKAPDEVHKPVDNIDAGQSMISAESKPDTSRPQNVGESQVKNEAQKPEKKNDSDIGVSMMEAGGKITPGAGGSIITEAGGEAVDTSFSIGLDTKSNLDAPTDSYASEHGGNIEAAPEGGEAKPKEIESHPTPPMKKENLNYGAIGEVTTEKRIELIKHHDTYQYDTLDDISKREELDPSKRNYDEKQLLDEERLKKIAQTVQDMSSADPTQDADEVVKKAIEQVVEEELKKERKVNHEPTLKHPDFNSKPKH